LWLSAPLFGAAQSATSKGTTFQWSGELVAADSATSTVTVKSRIAYQEAVTELKQFKPGEKVWVAWSGIRARFCFQEALRPEECRGCWFLCRGGVVAIRYIVVPSLTRGSGLMNA
jgi:hypothetical protein